MGDTELTAVSTVPGMSRKESVTGSPGVMGNVPGKIAAVLLKVNWHLVLPEVKKVSNKTQNVRKQ